MRSPVKKNMMHGGVLELEVNNAAEPFRVERCRLES